MEAIHILVVEDDPDINRLLCKIMENAGYDARPAFSGSEALLWAEKYDYDLVLLDLMLPGLTGEEFIAKIRVRKVMPIIVVSAKIAVESRVEALKLGADDFVTKPFDNQELLARVEAQLRRFHTFSPAPAEQAVMQMGDLVLDREAVTVKVAGNPVPLTAREFEILALLLSQPRKVFTRAQIYERVWGEEFFGDENTVNVHISNLRSKLGKEKEYIKTVWGIGFKINESP